MTEPDPTGLASRDPIPSAREPSTARVESFFRAMELARRRLAQAQIERTVAEGLGLDLDTVSFRVLLYLGERGDSRPRDIATSLLTALPNVSTALTRLETRKLVLRRVAPDDRRATIVRLTDRGRMAAIELQDALLAELRSCVASWTDDELRTGERMLRALAEELRSSVDSRVAAGGVDGAHPELG